MLTRRLVPLAFVAVIACTVAIPVTVVRELTLTAPAGDAEIAIPIDLTTESAIWSRRSGISSIKVDEVRARVMSTGATNRATTVALQLRFRPDGAPADGSQDVVVGDLPALPVQDGSAALLQGSDAVDALLLDAVKGTGRFSAVARSHTDDVVDAQVELQLKGSLAFDALGH